MVPDSLNRGHNAKTDEPLACEWVMQKWFGYSEITTKERARVTCVVRAKRNVRMTTCLKMDENKLSFQGAKCMPSMLPKVCSVHGC